MKNIKSHFKFNKQERSGIFFLLLLIALLLIGWWAYIYYGSSSFESSFSENVKLQQKINHLKEQLNKKDSVVLYPFNPNFISDYKGYVLGMSVEQIDRLHAFREEGKFVNSAKEFQEVTKIQDSVLKRLSPYFKFPSFKNRMATEKEVVHVEDRIKAVVIKDLNTATAAELTSVSGVGEVLSKRIIKYRDLIGGYRVNDQLYEVYYLDSVVANKVLVQFQVLEPSQWQKMDINTATVEDLSSLVYISNALANKIIAYRQSVGTISSLNELKTIEGFPIDKFNRIGLYLTL